MSREAANLQNEQSAGPIEIGARTIAMWSVALANGNWLGHLGRNAEGKLEFSYRWRWYRDEVIGQDSKDVRHFYSGTLSVPESEAIHRFREVVETLREDLDGRSWELVRGARSEDEFFAALRAMPGIHVGETVVTDGAT